MAAGPVALDTKDFQNAGQAADFAISHLES
jgi:hypothetical protein